MKAIALILSLAAMSAHADWVASNGKDSVRLFDKPCATAGVLERVPPQYHSLLRGAQADIGGKTHSMCWFVDGDAAHLLYGDGDQGLVPLAAFRDEPGA